MLDELDEGVDAAPLSTPDHIHAPGSMS